MSINNIELSDAIIAELFSKSLIGNLENVPDSSEKPTLNKEISQLDESNEKKIRILGNNSRNILIILQYPDLPFLPDHDLQFLNNILGACKLSLNDVAILNINNHPQISYKQLIPHFKAKVVILFGVTPISIGLPLNFPEFQIQAFDGTSYLLSPSLHGMEDDKETKSRLWTSLKRLFNI